MRKIALLFILAIAIFTLFLAASLAQQSETSSERESNIIFVVDVSGSMAWPAYQSAAELASLPEAFRNDLTAYRNGLVRLTDLLSEADKEAYFAGCLFCEVKSLDGTMRAIPKPSRNHPMNNLMTDMDRLKGKLNSQAEELKVTKMDNAKNAIIDVLHMQEALQEITGIRPNIALITFSDSANVKQGFTSDLQIVQKRVKEMGTSAGTDIGVGLNKAFTAKKKSLNAGRAATLIMLSDGRVNYGWDADALVTIYSEMARQNSTVIDTIGFGTIEDEVDKELLQRLAHNTGGRYVFSMTLNELAHSFLISGHHAIGNNVIYKSVGIIQQDEEREVGRFTTDYRTSDVVITLDWGGSELHLYLMGETGNRIPEGTYTITKKESLLIVTLKNPPAGAFTIMAEGIDVPEGNLDYNVVVSEKKGAYRFIDLIKDNLVYGVIGLIVIFVIIVLLVVKRRSKNKSGV